MEAFLFILGTVVFFLVCAAGLGLLVVGLPGTWLIVASNLVYCLATDGRVPWQAVAIYGVLALGAEVFEFLVGAWGTKKYGGTKWGMAGAVLGGIAGAALLTGVVPIIGTIIGAFLGSFLGAFGMEYAIDKDFRRARKAGTGAFLGRVAAVVVKAGLAVSMIISSFVLIVF